MIGYVFSAFSLSLVLSNKLVLALKGIYNNIEHERSFFVLKSSGKLLLHLFWKKNSKQVLFFLDKTQLYYILVLPFSEYRGKCSTVFFITFTRFLFSSVRWKTTVIDY